jgi:hypothetical protein
MQMRGQIADRPSGQERHKWAAIRLRRLQTEGQPMTREEEDKQELYRQKRRLWAIATGKPYLEDGGVRGGRSGDATPREAATDKEGSNF